MVSFLYLIGLYGIENGDDYLSAGDARVMSQFLVSVREYRFDKDSMLVYMQTLASFIYNYSFSDWAQIDVGNVFMQLLEF